MPSQILEERAQGGGRGPLDGAPLGDGAGGGGPEIFGDPTRFGLWAFMGTVCMLFIGFTSAYILRCSSADWRPLAPPLLLWLNTAVLLASSLTIEGARKRLRGWELRAVRGWVAATGLLGALFVIGQLGAWQQLAAQGVFLASNPHSSFFYVLTGVHVVHLLGGLCWFGVVFGKLRSMGYTPGEDGLGLFATYWHFLAALWIYLLFLLFVL